MWDNEQESIINDISSINSIPNIKLKELFSDGLNRDPLGIKQNEAEKKYFENNSPMDKEPDLLKGMTDGFSLEDDKNRAETISINDNQLYFKPKNQNNQQSNQNAPLNCTNLIRNEIQKRDDIHVDESAFAQNIDNSIAEKNEESEKDDDEIGENNPKKDIKNIKAKKIKFEIECDNKPQSIECTGKKRKREEEGDILSAKNNNINSNIVCEKKVIFQFKKIKKEKKEISISDYIHPMIFQYIIDSTKNIIDENPYPKYDLTRNEKKPINNKRITTFEEKININLEDALKPYLKNKIPPDKFENELSKILKSSTPLIYIVNIINEKEKNLKFKIGKIFIKKLFNMSKLIIKKNETQKQKENKAKKNKSKKSNIIINDSKNNYIIKFDEKSINNNLFNNYNSNDLCSLKVDIFEINKEQKGNIFIENIKNKDSTAFESNTTINNKDDIKIRNDHLINIIKNMIIEQLINDFNEINKSNYILKIKKEKPKKKQKKNKKIKNDNENLKNIEKEEEEEEEEDDEDIEKNSNENKKRNDNEKKGDDNNEEEDDNSEEEQDDSDEEQEKVLFISINNNNNIKKDYIFMKNSFKTIINKAKKKQNKENYIETEEADKLLKTKKYIYLQNILSNAKKSNDLFEKCLNKKVNNKKAQKLRNITNEIFKRKDLDGLILMLLYHEKIRDKNVSYKKKDSFLNEFKNSDYSNLYLNNDNDTIQREMEELKKMAENIMKYLKDKKDKLEKNKKK